MTAGIGGVLTSLLVLVCDGNYLHKLWQEQHSTSCGKTIGHVPTGTVPNCGRLTLKRHQNDSHGWLWQK